MIELKKSSDNELIKFILSKKCNNSIKELVDRHSGIIFNIGKKYCKNCNLDLQELHDNRYWIVYNAVKSFDPKKGSKFSTWLGNQIRFFCLNYRNKNSKLIPIEDSALEFFINQNSKIENNNKKEVISNIIDLFNQISDSNTKKAIYYRYFYDQNRILNYAEIAKILNVTPQTVLNWHNKFINFAKKKLTNKSINLNI